MRKIYLLALMMCISGAAFSQIRPFDNSKAILPWLYNPASSFTKDFQMYAGYDGRGSSNFTPQSILAGIRYPVHHTRRERHKAPTMIGVQFLSTSQDIVKSSTIGANFAHQVAFSPTLHFAFGLGAGINNMRYNQDELLYFDQQDPTLASGQSLFNVHLNAGASLMIGEQFIINLAAPYLVKDQHANFEEIIFRASYIVPVNPEVKLITSLNLDTYNKNMIYGGDVRVEFKKMFSVLAGADRYKFNGGVLVDVKPFSFGYTYGQNFSDEINHFVAHQISLYSHIDFSN